jgi:heat shock protein HslJ
MQMKLRYALTKARLTIATIVMTCAVVACDSNVAPANAENQLLDTTWALVEIQSMDDSVATPPAGKTYSVKLIADGSVAVQADCNSGMGSYSHEGSSLEFGPMATTRMFCGPDGFDNRFLQGLGFVRSYILNDGKLYMATMADGAILEFVATADSE